MKTQNFLFISTQSGVSKKSNKPYTIISAVWLDVSSHPPVRVYLNGPCPIEFSTAKLGSEFELPIGSVSGDQSGLMFFPDFSV